MLITTDALPALPAGVVNVIEVAELTVNEAETPPTVTLVMFERLLPVIVTEVPPEALPLVGEMLDIVGTDATDAE